jgi:4-amino-4-deoxy-L-arabinose transferase-like glycosyltransferase
VFVVAFVLRLAATATLQGLWSPPNVSANPDQLEYEALTYNLSVGNGYVMSPGVPTAVRPPGAPLTYLPIYSVFGRSFLAIRLWIILLSALTCVLAIWLGSLSFGRVAGLVAGAWLAVYPGHLYYSMHILSETVYCAWLALACCLSLVALNSDRHRWDVAAAVAWTFAILTRIEAILTIPAAAGMLLLSKRDRRRSVATHYAVQVCVALLLLSGWVGRNYVEMHVMTLSTQRGFTFWGAHNDITFGDVRRAGTWLNTSEIVDARHPLGGAEIQKEAQAWRYGLDAVHTNLRRLPFLIVMKLFRLVSPFFDTTNTSAMWLIALGWCSMAPLACYGCWLVLRRGGMVMGVLLAPVLATIGTTILFYGSERYRDSLAPILVVLSAEGLCALAINGLRRQRSSEPIAAEVLDVRAIDDVVGTTWSR